jgi:DNA-binding MarR family transcriptional regulator
MARQRKRSSGIATDGGHSSAAVEATTSILNSFVGYNLRRAAAKQRERFRNVFEPYDIRPVQLSALMLLLDSMPMSQSDFGKALDIKRANVVTLLHQLENRGLVVRKPASEDRRAHMLFLTSSGKALATKLVALHDKLEQDLAHSLGKGQLTTLIELLRAFRAVDSRPKLR